MLTVLLIALILILVWALLTLFRNDAVYEFRIGLINEISEANKRDVARGEDYTGWRYVKFSEQSYSKMVVSVWRPLDVGEWYGNELRLND
jgi:hypothetical protein